MTRLAARLLVALVVAVSGGTSRHMIAARAAVDLQTIAVVGGQPDDITTDAHGHLVWGNLARGTVEQLQGGRVVTLARGLSVPEGVLVLPNGTIIIAEQGRDRITRIGSHGRPVVVYGLRPVPGQEGVDGIGRDPRNGDLLIPDSPRGTLLRMTSSGKRVRLAARGLGRPVDAAVDAQGNVLVPDEHLGTLVVVSPRGRVSYRGSLSIPDDVAVDRSGRVWITTLGDGGLWLSERGGAPRRVLVGLGNPQGLTLDRCSDPIVVEQNAGRIVRLLLTSASARCRF